MAFNMGQGETGYAACVCVLILVGWGTFRNLLYIEQQTDAKQCVHHAKTETEENLKL